MVDQKHPLRQHCYISYMLEAGQIEELFSHSLFYLQKLFIPHSALLQGESHSVSSICGSWLLQIRRTWGQCCLLAFSTLMLSLHVTGRVVSNFTVIGSLLCLSLCWWVTEFQVHHLRCDWRYVSFEKGQILTWSAFDLYLSCLFVDSTLFWIKTIICITLNINRCLVRYNCDPFLQQETCPLQLIFKLVTHVNFRQLW